jgi:hypothetical protein
MRGPAENPLCDSSILVRGGCARAKFLFHRGSRVAPLSVRVCRCMQPTHTHTNARTHWGDFICRSRTPTALTHVTLVQISIDAVKMIRRGCHLLSLPIFFINAVCIHLSRGGNYGQQRPGEGERGRKVMMTKKSQDTTSVRVENSESWFQDDQI